MVKFLKARSEDVALVTVDADGMNEIEQIMYAQMKFGEIDVRGQEEFEIGF